MIRRDIARTYPEHDFFKRRGEEGREAPGQVRIIMMGIGDDDYDDNINRGRYLAPHDEGDNGYFG